MTDLENADDPALDAEELLAVASLSQDDLGAIDQALVANSQSNWRKVALVVALSMDVYPDQFQDIPDTFYAQRIRELVSRGQLQAQGNLFRMRSSEVRVPVGHSSEA